MLTPRISLLMLLVLLCSPLHIKAQSHEFIAKEGSFGIDKTNKIIVWHIGADSSLIGNNQKTSISFDNTVKIAIGASQLSYSVPLHFLYLDDPYTLYITRFPVINMVVEDQLKDNLKIPGRFSYFHKDNYLKSVIGIEYRGNLSLSFPKKSYDLEFWTDSINRETRDVKFKGLLVDDDLILDGLYNEPLRLRSFMATKLWKDIHKPYYLESEPKAESGFDVIYVEVFINQKYEGIYALSESVSRKLLHLKRNEDRKIRGELFKAASYEGAPGFIKAPDYNNVFPHWGGFEMEYPIVDYRSHWENLFKLVDLVVNGDDIEFAKQITKEINIDNAVDYYLFVNLLRATDNLGKNYYLAKYDEGEPYFFVPWDLDGVMGIIQDGKRIATTDDMLNNGLYNRLLKLSRERFRDKLKQRWNTLRKTEFSNDNLFGTIERIYKQMNSEKIYERENIIWPLETDKSDHYEYLKDWLNNRLIFLDQHYEGM